MEAVRIASTSSYVPVRRMHNEEFSGLVETSHEWIVSHTGITNRHIAASDEGASDLAVKASRGALDRAGVSAGDLGTVIVATSTPDYSGLPSTACIVQDALGAVSAGAFDLTAACSGFVYALEVGRSLMQGDRRPVLVVASEVMSRILDWSDRNTCVLFGDGAGAVVLTPSTNASCILDSYLRSDGSGSGVLYREGGCRLPPEEMASLAPHLVMKGRPVFNFAVRALVDVVRHFMEFHDLASDDIARIVPHQANFRILQAASKRLDIGEDRFFLNIHDVANTSAASIPIALDHMSTHGLLQAGDLIITVAFGAGLTYGGNLIRW